MNEMLAAAFENAGSAIARLGEALEQSAGAPSGSLMIDGTIQRFEFSIETTWKLLRKILQTEKVEDTLTPKQIMVKAYGYGLIDEEDVWLAMLDDRNLTSHTYRQKLANEIYARIQKYHIVMQSTFDKLQKKYG
ncbi:MAG: HI0074 family nucleotidyltransferase substrate-binding subunit [Alphaproteobacteria bacterium]|nr:HI0074 family nucleotidyltransferase substrate-binding subunit [Alphaproteobacteria bacterium]